ncbi:hypothetical protein, partial [Verminephrobacter aporrectodeae]|uniref:hypothetical protein n=1 Tax=Verminephrobacter aporrectodeae TaxID=1110389 RepID=UPI0022446B07
MFVVGVAREAVSGAAVGLVPDGAPLGSQALRVVLVVLALRGMFEGSELAACVVPGGCGGGFFRVGCVADVLAQDASCWVVRVVRLVAGGVAVGYQAVCCVVFPDAGSCVGAAGAHGAAKIVAHGLCARYAGLGRQQPAAACAVGQVLY